jgi:hypothetical protein
VEVDDASGDGVVGDLVAVVHQDEEQVEPIVDFMETVSAKNDW